ncbi:uncharacterized protein LOC110654465 [Hevea brasiliensis]|uniref:uncharacterized protein LOC110654465 n=1 Tax=Hevea brasiliensis TaxID=3981 RepID=UPI0025D409C5|nr:uncharacterized protein LOC110654465 [Hevea brasiliensis]
MISVACFLKYKPETFENFRKFKAMVEKQSGQCIKALRTDRGGEFLSKEFNHFCEENGICRELMAPYTLEKNGVAERKNHTIVEMARSLLKGKGLPNQHWAEAIATVVYLLNISPTKVVLNQTPYEAWKEGSWNWCSSNAKIQQDASLDEVADLTPANSTSSSPSNSNNSRPASSPSSSSKGSSSSSSNELSDETPPRKFRSLREIYESYAFALFAADPTTYEEVIKMEEWRYAMKEELMAIQRNDTWELMNLPNGKNVVGLKWIFKTKYNADGSVQKHKASLVAKGYSSRVLILKRRFLRLLDLKW